jgi:hypothetical protein
MQNNFFTDFCLLLINPKKFITNYYLSLDNKRKYLLGYFGVFLGLLLGNIFSLLISIYLQHNNTFISPSLEESLKILGLEQHKLETILETQNIYSIICILLSPLLGFVLPHLLGGLLWLLLLNKPNDKISLNKIIDCTRFSLSSLFYYSIPIFGPFISIIMLSIVLSNCLLLEFKLTGFIKHIGIWLSIYVVLFLGSDALKLLAMGLSGTTLLK